MSCDEDQKDACISNGLQLQNHSSALSHKIKSFPSATSFLSRSPIAYNTTASLYNLTCTDCVDLGKCQNRFGQFFCSKNGSKYLDVKLKNCKKVNHKEFRLVQNLTMGRHISTSLCI